MTKKNDNPFNSSRTFEAVLREHHLSYPECANKLTKVGDKYIAVLNKDYWPKTSLADKVTSAHQNTARYFGEHMHGESLMPFGIGHKDNIVMYAFSEKNDAMYFMDFAKDPDEKTYEQLVSALEKAAGKNNGKRNYLPMLLQSYVQRHFDDPGFLREPMKPLFDRLEKDYKDNADLNPAIAGAVWHFDSYKRMAENQASSMMVNSIIDNATFDVPCQTHLPRPLQLSNQEVLTGFRSVPADPKSKLLPLVIDNGTEVARDTPITYKDYYSMYSGMMSDERADLRIRMHSSDTMSRAEDYLLGMLISKVGKPMSRDAYNYLSDLSYDRAGSDMVKRQEFLNILLDKAYKAILGNTPRSRRWSSTQSRFDECATFMKDICHDKVTHVKDKTYSIQDITDLCFEDIPKKAEDSVFFRVITNIHESRTGDYAHHVSNDGLEGQEVRSLGVFLNEDPDKCRILYHHQNAQKNFGTVLGRPISELSQGEMKGLLSAFSEALGNKRTLPMIFNDDVYMENENEDPLISIRTKDSIEMPYDAEQMNTAVNNNVEYVDKSINEYYFNDYDDAILFAYENTENLTMRDKIRHIGTSPIVSQNVYNWQVVSSSNNMGMKALAEAHHGTCEAIRDDGQPLIIAKFHDKEDAQEYKHDISYISPTESRQTRAVDAAVERITNPAATSFTQLQLARIGYETLAFNSLDTSKDRMKNFIDLLVRDQRLKGVEPAWINAAIKDLQDFAKGKEIAVEQEASIKY